MKIIVSYTFIIYSFIHLSITILCKPFQVQLFAFITITYGKAQHFYTLYRPGVLPAYAPYNTPQNLPQHYKPEARIDLVEPVPYHNE